MTVWAVLLLLCVCVSAIKPVEFNACDTDVDCEPSNAICFDGVGPTDQRRCMCQYGYTWDPLHHRCDLPAFVTNSSMVVVTRQSPLYYSEQINQTIVGVLQFTRGRSVLPSQWLCDRTTQFCSAYDATLGIEVANFNYSSVANPSNSSSVPGVYQYWRCSNSSIGRATRLNDNMIMNASSALQGYGMRPLWEYCPPCNVWCQHGTCSPSGDTCTCDTGWFGARCDQQSALVALNRYNAKRPCTFSNESQACSVNEQCYIDRYASVNAGTLKGVCWCMPGFIPDTESVAGVGCLVTAVASVPSVLVDFVPNSADWRYFNATYTTALPQYTWVQDATTLYATRGSATTGLTDPAWRINTSLLLLERCLDNRNAFFFRRESLLNTTIITDRSKHSWCGYGGYAGSCGNLAVAATSLSATTVAAAAWNGSCVCASGIATGSYCQVCLGDYTGPVCGISRASCRSTYCAGRGDCVDTQPYGTCVCDRPYLADSACAVSAATCGQANCSAHGECVDTASTSCVCDVGWKGARCDVSDALCRTQRCSNHGQCSTETQGCTCDAFYMRSNCSRVYCAYGQPTTGTAGTTPCNCNASFTGLFCETRRCGMYGDYNVQRQQCDCYGVMAPNTVNGSCTSHICGARFNRGYPYAGRWCTCYPGNRLVASDTVAQCQKP